MTAIRSSAPAVRVAPRVTVQRATAPAAAPAPKPAPKPVQAAKPAAAPAITSRTAGTVGGLAAGGAVGWIFGSVLASGGAVIADAIAGKAGKPTVAQGLVGGASGLVLGAGIWGLTAFAGGMAMVPWVFAAAIPMGLAAAVLGGTAIGSFLPGRKA